MTSLPLGYFYVIETAMKNSDLEALAIDNLITMAVACAKARDCQLSTISRLAHGDPDTFDKIRRGEASITLRKYETSMAWLRDRENWPEKAVIPKIWEPWRRARPAA